VAEPEIAGTIVGHGGRRGPIPLLRDRPLVVLVALGIALRFAYAFLLAQRGYQNAGSEAWQVAVHLAHGQGFAGAYKFGDLPTAHVLPIPPLFVAGIYAIFGVASWPSEMLLLSGATAVAVVSFLLFNQAFAILGTPRPARLLALAALLCCNPFISQEVIDFRVWDGGLASALSGACLLLLLKTGQRHRVAVRSLAALVATNALLFFVNPILGVAAYLCTGLLMVTRLSPVRFAQGAGIAVLALALLIVPWTLRNERVMGKAIPLRSNAGLELAVSMYPGAEQPTDQPAVRFADRLRAVHPQNGRGAFDAMMRAGGEVPYFAELGARSSAWIAARPGDAANVALGHVRQMLVPPPWLFNISSTNQKASVVKSLLTCAAHLAGLLGIALALVRRRPAWIFVALLVAVPTLLTSPFQPIARYIYLIFPPLVFAGADLIASLLAMAGWKSLSPAVPERNTPDRQAA
jgi:hypothetical protein